MSLATVQMASAVASHTYTADQHSKLRYIDFKGC